jgi:hypothetical protein
MAEQEVERSRVVVETPHARREYERAEAVRHPERNGVSGGVLAAVVVGVIALAALMVLFLMNRQDTANETLANQPPQTTIVQQPAQQQPPIIVQQPATTTQPAPVIITQPATGGSAPSSGNDDAVIQTAIDKKFSDDPAFSSLGVTATVFGGKVTLMGTVKSQALKNQIERAVKNVKGVLSVDNQISVG